MQMPKQDTWIDLTMTSDILCQKNVVNALLCVEKYSYGSKQ